MIRTLHVLSALVLLAVLAPSASAQSVDCDHIPASTGAMDPAYRACFQPMAPVEAAGGTTHLLHESNARFTRLGSSPLNCPYTPPNGAFLNGGDYRGDDHSTWYGVDNLGQAISLDVATCAVTPLGIVGSGWTGVTYDYTTGNFYGLQVTACGGDSRLFVLDFDALTATPVGGLDPTNGCGIALAAEPFTGKLYSYDIISDNFLSINKTTGQSTVIGPIGFDANFGQGMDFDDYEETCYLYAFNSFTFQAELRTVNLSTGNTTLVGSLPGQTGTGSGEADRFEECKGPRFEGPVTATVNGDQTVVTFAGRVANEAPGTMRLRLNVDYARQGGGPSGMLTYGPANIPPTDDNGVPFSINQPIPGAAPPGTYDLTFELAKHPSNEPCDTYRIAVTLSAPRTSGGSAAWTAAPVVDLFAAEASIAPAVLTPSPNPFRDGTTLHYTLEQSSPVRLAVYDVLGREVAVLVDGPVEAGTHAVSFDARGLPSGTYIARLTAGSHGATQRMTLLR